MIRPRTPARARARGFGLIEVLVAVVVIAIGLLGVAKLQAYSLSATSVSSLRSLAALEAASLASSMHANRAYWGRGSVAAAPGVTIAAGTGGAPSISDATLATPVSCETPAGGAAPQCTPDQMAAADLQRWAAVVVGRAGTPGMLPSSQTTIICSTTVGAPIDCTVQITWSEGAVALDRNATGALSQPTYVLHVEP